MQKERTYEIGSSVITLRIGNILDSATQVFLSSDDNQFSMKGGVSKVIAQAAGGTPKAELEKKPGNFEIGDVAVTSAGNLTGQAYIFHGVTRLKGQKRGNADPGDVEGTIKKIIENSLHIMDGMQLKSIAFPAIGTGFAGYKPQTVAAVMAKNLTTYVTSGSSSFSIEIVLNPSDLAKDIDYVSFFREFDDLSGWKNHVVREHAVVFVHGIRTEAVWFDEAQQIFRSFDNSINPITAGYEFFDLVRFLLPFDWLKKSAIKRVESKIRWVYENEASTKISIIAHSFGTYIVGKILTDNPDLKIHRLVLCGGVLSQKFNWEKLSPQLSKVDEHEYPTQCVLNDCGWRDIWPVFAQSFTWGYGSSGRFGFQSPLVLDRYHDRDHSDFFDEKFVREYWCSFVSNGEVKISPEKRPSASWIVKLLTIVKVPYVLLAAAVVVYMLA